MAWSDILNEVKKIKSSNPEPVEIVTEPVEESAPTAIPDTEKKWWQVMDVLSRNDELLQAILQQLQAMGAVPAATPSVEALPEMPLPAGLAPKLDVLTREQIRTKQLLEGFNFTTNQSTVPTPGTPTEVISTVRTYLIIIRAHITNVGDIYIGGQGVTAGTGFIVGAGESVAVQIDAQKKRVFVDAATAGDGVSWMALVD